MNQTNDDGSADRVEPEETEILTHQLRSRLRWALPTSAFLTTGVFALSFCVPTDSLRILVLPLSLVVVMAGLLKSSANKVAGIGGRDTSLGKTWVFSARNVVLGSLVVVLAGLIGFSHVAVYVLGLLSIFCVLLAVGEISSFLLVRDTGGLLRRMILDVLVSLVLVYLFGVVVFCVVNRPNVLSVPDYERGRKEILRIPISSVPGPEMNFVQGQSLLKPEYWTIDFGFRLYRPAIVVLSHFGVLVRREF